MTPILIHLNCPDRETARTLAAALLDARLVASANILPAVESHYVWQGARTEARETPLLLKTQEACLPAIEALVAERHPYDVPPLIAMPLRTGAAYADWIAAATASEP